MAVDSFERVVLMAVTEAAGTLQYERDKWNANRTANEFAGRFPKSRKG